MKLEGLDHPKTLDLAARLKIKRVAVIGHLELLWAFASKKAPQGNIGKWPDGAIARACDWEDDPPTFIKALIESGFVDVDDEHRLVIHDWHEHAQGWVRAKLKNTKLEFVKPKSQTSEPTSTPTSTGTSTPTSEPSSRARVPSQAKPSQASKKPQPLGKGLNGADAQSGRRARPIRKASLDAWDRSCKVIDAIRGNRSFTWNDADRTLNDPAAVKAIEAAGGHRQIADRTQYTQGEIKRRFREYYEQAIENPREDEGDELPDTEQNGEEARDLRGLLSEATRGLPQ